MATVKATIKNEIVAFITDLNSGDVTKNDPDEIIDRFSDRLAGVIQNAIRSADVQPGIPVATTGTAIAQTGNTTGAGSLL